MRHLNGLAGFWSTFLVGHHSRLFYGMVTDGRHKQWPYIKKALLQASSTAIGKRDLSVEPSILATCKILAWQVAEWSSRSEGAGDII